MKTIYIIGLILSLSLSSCVSYQSQPLEGKKILQDIDREQRTSIEPKGRHLTFDDAARTMAVSNREIAELKARYQKLQSVADLKTPIENPSIGSGYSFGRRLDVSDASQNQPFLNLGFSIPLSGRLKITDDINQIVADNALLDVQLRHRHLALKLRHAYIQARLAQEHFFAEEMKSSNLVEIRSEIKKGLEAGLYSSIDKGRITAAIIAQDQVQLERQNDSLKARYNLSRMINRQLPTLASISFDALPTLPEKLNPEDLKALLQDNNVDLRLLEAEYLLAEKRLQLEIKKQYPDLEMNTGWEREPGEKRQTFSLGIGIKLPFFDRNQQAIAAADKEREVLRRRYEKIASECLLNLEQQIAIFNVRRRALTLYEKELLPCLEENLKDASKALAAGIIDLQRYWDFQQDLLDARGTKASYVSELYHSVQAIEEIVNHRLEKLSPVPTKQ